MYYFKYAETQEEKIAAFKLRYKIYCDEKKWFNGENYKHNLESDIYDTVSDIFIACDSANNIVGTARLIHNTDCVNLQIAKHPSIKENEGLHKCAEISRLVTEQNYRSGPVSVGLIRMIYNHVLKTPEKYRFLYICVDAKFLTILNGIGFSFYIRGKPDIFLDDLLVVARMNVAKMDEQTLQKNPAFHQWLHEDCYLLAENTSFTGFWKKGRRRIKQHEKRVKTETLLSA